MIDPVLQIILDAFRASGFTLPEPLDAVKLRELMDVPMPAPPVAVAERRDVMIGRVAARLYHPQPGSVLPVTLFFHGGGWVVGTLDTYDRLAAGIATGSGCAVLSVDYRRAPEHPFPAGLDDCAYVAEHLAAHAAGLGIDASRYAVAGDSAGGNLSAALALRLKDAPVPPRHQLLMYPVIAPDFETQSYLNTKEDDFLPPSIMRWFWRQYVGDAVELDPLAAPILAASLAGVAPATVIVAGNDPLHDEGVTYAGALKAAGVAVELFDYPTAIHGFMSFLGMAPLADEAVGVAVAILARALRA